MTQLDAEKPSDSTASTTRRPRRVQVGVVKSDANNKTIKVVVDRLIQHPKYEKRVRRSITLIAHDEENQAKVGDLVEIMETRRISKTKTWRFVRILRPAVSRG